MDEIIVNKNTDDKAVLQQLKERFKNDKIYTFAGETLIKVRPVRDVKCHGKNVSESYHLSKWREKPAHLFSVADDAFQGITGTRGNQAENQCIILRGLSGSGKTEAAKRLISHLVTMTGTSELQKKAVQVSLILEAFGCARTALNPNSNRFGQYTTLYTSHGKVVGMKTNEFLLEKWRVSEQADEDTNFHMFYFVLAGQGFTKQMLQQTMDHRYLQNRQTLSSANISAWQTKCEAVVNAMNIIGFSNQEQADINMILISILSLGDITIQRSRVGEASLDPDALKTLQNVSDFLGLNSLDLEETIIFCEVNINGEKIQRRVTRDEAEDNRDELARLIYQRLFAWIIYRINFMLRPTSASDKTQEQEIGILDMPGFENIRQNSFEQCYFNFVEEILYGLYTKHVFRVTEEECQQDDIKWSGISVPNNDDIVDLFLAKPSGLLATVEEATRADKGSDDNFVSKLSNNLKNSRFFEPGVSSMKHCFSVTHCMEKVTYDTRGWLTKNQFTLSPTATLMLQNAENSLLSTLFKTGLSSRGTWGTDRMHSSTSKRQQHPVPTCRTLTTTTHFKNAIQSLLDKIENMNPHFVCCIRPNCSNRDTAFDDQFVLKQLKWLGVVSAAKVYSEGFSQSLDHQEFLETYQSFLKNQGPATVGSSAAEKCKYILTSCQLKGWQIGRSKVFLKGHHLKVLSQFPLQSPTDSQHQGNGQNSASDSIYSLAQPVSPVTEIRKPKLAVRKYAYAEVTPKALRGNAKTSGGVRLYPSLENTGSSSDTSDSDFEELEEKFLNVRRNEMQERLYGEMGTRQAAVRWFKVTQAHSLRQGQGGAYMEWCHGIITRKQAEELLSNKPKGCFLLRLGETRFGYSLSIKDDNRCRHYMVEQLMNGNYKAPGEAHEHKSLVDLINFYKKNRLSNFNGVLTVPCGQKEGDCDYLELMLTKEDEEQLNRLMNTARLEPTAPDYQFSGSSLLTQSPDHKLNVPLYSSPSRQRKAPAPLPSTSQVFPPPLPIRTHKQ